MATSISSARHSNQQNNNNNNNAITSDSTQSSMSHAKKGLTPNTPIPLLKSNSKVANDDQALSIIKTILQ